MKEKRAASASATEQKDDDKGEREASRIEVPCGKGSVRPFAMVVEKFQWFCLLVLDEVNRLK